MPFVVAGLLACAGPPGPRGPSGHLVVETDVTWSGTHAVDGFVEVADGATLTVSGEVRLGPGALLVVWGTLDAAEGTTFSSSGLGLGERVVLAGDAAADGIRVVDVPLRVDGDGAVSLGGTTFEGGTLEVRDRVEPFVLEGAAFTGRGRDLRAAIDLEGVDRAELRSVSVSGYWLGVRGVAPAPGPQLAVEGLEVSDGETGIDLAGPWTLSGGGVTVSDFRSTGASLGDATGVLAGVTVTDVGRSGLVAAGRVALVDVTVARATDTGLALRSGATVDRADVRDTGGLGISAAHDVGLTDVTVSDAGSHCVQAGDRLTVVRGVFGDCRYNGLAAVDALRVTDLTVERVATGISAGRDARLTDVRVTDVKDGVGVSLTDGTIAGATIARTGSHGISGGGHLVVRDTTIDTPRWIGVYSSGDVELTGVEVSSPGQYGALAYGIDATRVEVSAATNTGLYSYTWMTADCVRVTTPRDHGLYAFARLTATDVAVEDPGAIGVYTGATDLVRVTVSSAGSYGVFVTDRTMASSIESALVADGASLGIHGGGPSTQVRASTLTGNADYALYDLGVVDGSWVAGNRGDPSAAVAVGVVDGVGDVITSQVAYVDAVVAPAGAPLAPVGFDATCFDAP